MGSTDAATVHQALVSAATLVKRAGAPAAVILVLAAACTTLTEVTAAARTPTLMEYLATDTEF